MGAVVDVRLTLPDPKEMRSEVDKRGFVIIHDAVSTDFVAEQRKRWMPQFSPHNITRKFVRGNLAFGEQNFLSYSEIPDWCMYRHFEFLWNASADPSALDLHIKLHKYRNLAQGFDENYGLTYNPESYGFYISTSYYPANRGMLKAHTDGHADIPILHYMLPLTFKGTDYREGGLWCADKSGREHDIDALVRPGSIIFFDGRLKHWVDVIRSYEKNGPGRLAVFAIPTLFIKAADFYVLKRSVRISLLEIANKLGLVKFSKY